MRIKSVFKHSAQALAEGSLVALLIVGLIAGTALAGKPTGGAGTSAMRVDDGVFAGTTTAYRGTSTAVWVHAKCYQGGTIVFEQWRMYVDATATLSLGPTPSWSSGAANCTAEEGYYSRNMRWRSIGSTVFNVAAS